MAPNGNMATSFRTVGAGAGAGDVLIQPEDALSADDAVQIDTGLTSVVLPSNEFIANVHYGLQGLAARALPALTMFPAQTGMILSCALASSAATKSAMALAGMSKPSEGTSPFRGVVEGVKAYLKERFFRSRVFYNVNAMGSTLPQNFQLAKNTLIDIGEPAVPYLVEALKDKGIPSIARARIVDVLYSIYHGAGGTERMDKRPAAVKELSVTLRKWLREEELHEEEAMAMLAMALGVVATFDEVVPFIEELRAPNVSPKKANAVPFVFYGLVDSPVEALRRFCSDSDELVRKTALEIVRSWEVVQLRLYNSRAVDRYAYYRSGFPQR